MAKTSIDWFAWDTSGALHGIRELRKPWVTEHQGTPLAKRTKVLHFRYPAIASREDATASWGKDVELDL